MPKTLTFCLPKQGERVLALLPLRPYPEPATIYGYFRSGQSLLVRLDYEPNTLQTVSEWRILPDHEEGEE